MTILESIYFLGYSIKKHRALKGRKRLPCKVISVGNITLGGTGKTPATIALAEEAKRRGFQPCILTRGYKGKAAGPCFVGKGEGPLLDTLSAGDEAVLMAEKLRGVPVVKGKDRYEAGLFALQNLGSELLFILDDGFQHWRLERDKDILLIDGANPFGNRKLLPLGHLREPVSEIKRADVIVVTKVPSGTSPAEGGLNGSTAKHLGLSINDLMDEIAEHNSKSPVFFAEHSPSRFISSKGEGFALEWAKNKKFFGFCGIGNHHSFKNTLRISGIALTGFNHFRDHYNYTDHDIRSIAEKAKMSGAAWIVTTEKDIMRLQGLDAPENLVVLAVEFCVDGGFYEEVFKSMQ
jgi:tetraacyldisaccharide 4'-kinase